MATDRRLLELALKGLEAERTRIDQEMALLRSQLSGTKTASAPRKKRKKRKKTRRKKKKMSAAQRRAISRSMKKAWARRKKQS